MQRPNWYRVSTTQPVILQMIRPISWLDILFFCIFLLPNLFLQLPIRDFLIVCCLAIPYRIASTNLLIMIVLFILPIQLIYDRLTTASEWTLFQNLALRCVHFAFANLSPSVGRVAFSENQSFPFARFRTGAKAWTWRTKVSIPFH